MGPTEPEGLTDGADQQACGGDDGDDGTRGGTHGANQLE